MKKTKKNKVTVVTVLFLSLFFLVLLNNINVSLADVDNNDLTIENLDFQFIEYSDDKKMIENISSIDIELPSSTWNVTDIELNFTHIEYYLREIKNIEDNYNKEEKFLSKGGLEGLGIQIKLNDTTTIFGVYMNIKVEIPHSGDNIYVKIRGFNSSTNTPNSSVYGEVKVNRTISDGWNYQNFSAPILLPKGNFSLVMEGTIQAAAKYYWYYNDSNPNNPDLYRSEKSGIGWENGLIGAPFLYKLDQEIKGNNFYPETYNMTAEIGGVKYKILNGTKSDIGNLNLPNIDFSPNNKNLLIPVNDNKSSKLYFDLIYDIKLKNKFSADGSVTIKKNVNEWSIIPQISRTGCNYTIKFKYPNSWTNFTVKKKDIPLIHGVDYINNTIDKAIYILNDTIKDEVVLWEINAQSLNIDINLNPLEPEITAGTRLIAGVNAPLKGNYIYILYAGKYEIHRNTTSYNGEILPGGILTFSYVIPSTGPNGGWTAVMYWNNGTDAGVKTESFTVSGGIIVISGDGGGGVGGDSSDTIPSGIEPFLGIIILAVGAGGSLTTYQTIKSIKKKRDLHTQALYNKFKDNLSLNYLMISDNKSGLNVYEQFFAGKSLDPSLLSGFLEAIRNFGIELTGEYQKSETVKLEYQNSKILMNESRDFRLILIMSDNPSEAFINSITNLAKEIEKLYGPSLKNFRGGDVTMFSGIRQLIEKHLNVTFIYPLRIVERKELKLTRAEKLIIQRAKVIMKQTNLKHFFTTFLMPDQEYDPEKTKTIFNLIDKGIFQPINLNAENNNNYLKYN